MSKQPKRNPTRRDDLRQDYAFDYAKSRPNRFASQPGEQTIAVVLEPDVAEVFTSSKLVNRALRSVMKAAPPRKRRARQSATRQERKAG